MYFWPKITMVPKYHERFIVNFEMRSILGLVFYGVDVVVFGICTYDTDQS